MSHPGAGVRLLAVAEMGARISPRLNHAPLQK